MRFFAFCPQRFFRAERGGAQFGHFFYQKKKRTQGAFFLLVEHLQRKSNLFSLEL